MQQIISQDFKRIVSDKEAFEFSVSAEGVCLISITARAKNWAQNIKRLFDDDDLAIQIDGVPFYEFDGKQKEFSSPGSWNGNQLGNVHKTNWYMLPLASGAHRITFVVDGAPYIENVSVSVLGDLKSGLLFDTKILPMHEGGKLFFDIILKNIEVRSVSVSARAKSGDMRCVIDRVAEENTDSKRYRKFFWRNSEKTLTRQFATDEHIHTIALIGRGNPALLKINFGTSGYRLVQRGKIAMYKDIDSYPRAQLRKEPTSKSESLGELSDGEKIEVQETRVPGEMQLGKSNIWHKVTSQKGEGYVLSSYVEVEGQERGIIVQKIKRKAQEIGVDVELVLLLAGVESRYKPYATSSAAKGIFQLLPKAIEQIKQSESFEVTDPYDADQSIEGGIRYVHWLQKNWYHPPVKDWRMKLFLAYNQGASHVPPEKNIDLSRIEKPLRRKEAATHLKYYRDNVKKFDWRNILQVVLLTVLVGSSSLIPQNRGDVRPVKNEIPEQAASVITIRNKEPRIEFTQGPAHTDGVVTIYGHNGEIVVVIPENKIVLNGELPVKRADREYFSLAVYEKVYEYPLNTFYFFAANFGSCGSGGCSGAVFQIKKGETKPRFIVESSEIKSFEPSPDGKHITMVSQNRVEDTLFIFDAQNFTIKNIVFNLGRAYCAYVTSMLWKNELELEIESAELNCESQSGNPGVDKTLRYQIDSGEITTIDERPHLSS